MQILKRVGSTDVYPLIKNVSYSNIFDTLERSMPGYVNLFAEVRKGVNDINWFSPTDGWLSYAEADDVLRDLILSTVSQRVSEFRTAASSQPTLAGFVDDIVAVPGDEFYYYRFDEKGEIQVVITGWGYRKPQRSSVGAFMGSAVPQVQSVSICFVCDGQRLPDRQFIIQTPSRPISKSTGADGLYLLGDRITVGRTFSLQDVVTNQDFEIAVTKGQSIYELDLTPPAPTTFKLSPVVLICDTDGQPQANVNVRIAINGRLEQHCTDAAGSIRLPEGEFSFDYPNRMNVNLGDRPEVGQTFDIVPDRVEYKLVVPKPEPEPEPLPTTFSLAPVLIVRDTDGTPQADVAVQIVLPSGQNVYRTDASGCIQLPVTEYPLNAPSSMTATLASDAAVTQSYQLTESQIQYELTVPKAPVVVPDVRIQIRDVQGHYLPNTQVTIQPRQGVYRTLTTDAQGFVTLSSSEFVPGQKVKVLFSYTQQ